MQPTYHIFLIVFASTIFIGCSPRVDFINLPKDITTNVKNVSYKSYTINKKKTVYVGESIIEKSDLKESIRNVYEFKYRALDNYKNVKKGEIYHIRGYSESNSNIYYLYIFADAGNYRFLKIFKNGILASNDLFDYYGKLVTKDYIKNADIGFKQIKTKVKTKIKYLDNSFRLQLLYDGKNNNNIKITYREFTNDMARVAFYQNLTYNLSESNIIRYKNYRLKILKATNESITYVLLSD